MVKSPLGKKEGQGLEFKSRDALKNPSIIGREVVAMLNSEKGGVIWIGLAEDSGSARAIEPITSSEAAGRELTDHLIDTLEPSPTGSEVEVKAVEIGSMGSILRIKVSPLEERKPYAQIAKGGRHFLIRVGDRVRPMSREEIAREFEKGTKTRKQEADAVEAVAKRLLHERNEHWRVSDQDIWFRIQPLEELRIDVLAEDTKKLFRDPRLSNNRPGGWNFTSSLLEPRHAQDKAFIGRKEGKRVEIREDGGLLMKEELSRLRRGGEKEIYPWVLLELPTSFLRLASVLYLRHREDGSDTKVLADFALFGIRDWTLRPGSPDTPRFEMDDPEPYQERNNFVLNAPMVFDIEEIVTEPDRCAYRIIRKVYLEFGLEEEDIPHEFDRQTGKLAIPR